MTSIIRNSQAQVDKICEDAGITYLALFGSQARGDENDLSDVDLLVEFKETPSLIGFIQTKQKFEKIFNKKVDLVTRNSLSKYLKPYILQDLKTIYG